MTAKNVTAQVDRDVAVRDATGETTEAVVTLPGTIFDVALNVPLIHQVVEAQRAAMRSGSANTKTRGEVSGGGKKPWRQKGTGRARHGSIRSPQWKGGGVVFGPKPRSYKQRTPRKMTAGALRSALSDRARNESVYVFSELVEGEVPSTKGALATLQNLNVKGHTLLILDNMQDDSLVITKSYSNVPGTKIVDVGQLAVYDVMKADQLVFTTAALENYIERVQKARARNYRTDVAADTVESELKGKDAALADTSILKQDKAAKDSDEARKDVKEAKKQADKDAQKVKKDKEGDVQ